MGDYELLEEIAHGGMGVVYRARQITLDRVVAVKMLLPGLSSPEYLRRFRTEASTAAGLQHPHIVAIHEVGAWQGRQYLVMDYVAGRSLAQVISDFRFQISDFRRSAQWLKAIAEAVHYAHEHGILHRDLKPSNVLIDEQGQPRVTDFGLAKRFDERSQLTLSGQVLGSPSYLPPEQAEAKRGKVSRRSDVYGLGATLYHAMTGRPPFQGETPTEVLQQVLNREPVEPRRLNPAIPRDLETICLKCLEKEPARRYASAQMVAEELGRFLENQPVQARAIGPAGKAWRWCQRKPVVAGLTASLILAVILGIAGVLRQSYQANAQRRRAENLLARSEQERYAANIALVQSLIEQTQFERARELLADELQTRYRGWEWGWLLGRCHLDLMTLPHPMRTTCAFSPDGTTLATTGNDGEIRLWNLETGEVEQVLRGTAEARWPSFSPDGKRLVAVVETQPATVWDVASGSILFRLTNSSPVYVARFSPDGTLIATGDSDGRVRLFDARDRQVSGEIETLRLLSDPPGLQS
jgi:eukaryotic-like serine/threonine-protein kinase